MSSRRVSNMLPYNADLRSMVVVAGARNTIAFEGASRSKAVACAGHVPHQSGTCNVGNRHGCLGFGPHHDMRTFLWLPESQVACSQMAW